MTKKNPNLITVCNRKSRTRTRFHCANLSDSLQFLILLIYLFTNENLRKVMNSDIYVHVETRQIVMFLAHLQEVC